MSQPSEQDRDELRADELRFRARRNIGSGSGRNAPRILLVVLLFAGMVFVGSVAVYLVNRRALTHEPEAQAISTQNRNPAPVQATQEESPQPVARNTEGSMLYKCKSPGGSTSYTNEPCAATQETVWARSVEPDRRVMPTHSTSQAASAGQQPQVVYSPSDPPSQREVQRAQCASAKRYEADVRRRRGLKITFDELRRLSDMVYEACKGL